ncbi:MAG: hypothetical protein J5737_02495 [Bacteroidales bacterium]|nr:hypothetical protein [Bacteroidales bacterium]
MKLNYVKPNSEPVQFALCSLLADSGITGTGSAEGITIDGESDFDSFFGA